MTGNTEVITGNDYKRMIAGAYSAFLLEYENINALNGDSLLDKKAGTHILRTIGAAAMSLRDLQAVESIGGVSKRAGSAAVLGARGNAVPLCPHKARSSPITQCPNKELQAPRQSQRKRVRKCRKQKPLHIQER